MNYFTIIDCDAKKYTIKHLRNNENMYHDYVHYLNQLTNHNIIGKVNLDALSDPFCTENHYEFDEMYFEPSLQEFKMNNYQKYRAL